MDDELPEFRVEPLGLNLRSSPRVEAGTKMVVLPRGHRVTGIGSAEAEGWLRVSTEFEGRELEGYVARRYLTRVEDFETPALYDSVSSVHLREDHPRSSRDRAGGRAYPIGESDRPVRDVDGPREQKIEDLVEIVEWLDVGESARYQASGGSTYCNVYAHDYCYLADVYLPRVWWTERSVGKLQAGETVEPEYGRTLRELNANSLFEWLSDFGSDFGWTRLIPNAEGVGGLQEAANGGGVGVIVGQRNELNRPGHVTVVVPEHGTRSAFRSGGRVTRPLQSQAGSRNMKYTTHHWWTHERFRAFGFWVHD